jgi:predicted MPP superfamily phosphohydrolase
MGFVIIILALIATAFMLSYFFPWAVCKLVGIFIKPVGKIARKAGKVFLAVAVSCFIFGLGFGWRLLKVRHVDIFFDDLPEAFDGYKIAQLSDLHLGTYSRSHGFIAREVRRTMAEQPDLIVFTGDIVNFMPKELRSFTDILSGLHAPDGVWSIMGNHDYVMYNDKLTAAQRAHCIQEIQDMERSMGWHLMLNENIILRRARNYISQSSSHAATSPATPSSNSSNAASNFTNEGAQAVPQSCVDSIALIGVEHQGRKAPYPRRADLPKALSGLPDGIFKILLSHDPTFWDSTVLPYTDIDLTLSGHTHAFQFRLWNFSPCRLRFKRWAGLYTAPNTSSREANSRATEADDRKLFISTGSGGNVPFRFGSWPEIDIITLHRR